MTDSLVTAVLIVAKGVIVVLGGTVSYLAYRASRRTGSAALRSLAVGFGVVTLGGVVGGGLNQLFGVGLQEALAVESLVSAAGFAVIGKSLYVDVHVGA